MKASWIKIVLAMLCLCLAQATFSEEQMSNGAIVTKFINEDILKNIHIKVLYKLDDVLKQLGKIKGETLEKAKIDYEGMKGSFVRKIEYQRFYAIIYKLANGHELFGYIELKPELKYSTFNYGTPLQQSIALSGSSINKWNERKYSIYGTYQEDWSANVTVDVDQDNRIRKVVINIGDI